MTTFTVYTADSTPEAAIPILRATKASCGFIPNLQATMAASPELLAGYTALWNLFAKTTLTPQEQQVVYPASNYTFTGNEWLKPEGSVRPDGADEPGVCA